MARRPDPTLLVLLGSLGLLGAAAGRIPELGGVYVLEPFIASMLAYDLASQRRFHLCAVQGETESRAAARLSGIPSSIIKRTSSRRPAGPSRALACAMSGPS